jgi:uncharacterized protein involved in response to NO
MSIFQLGFRPFYTLASVFAIVALIVWLLAFAGYSGTGGYLQSVVWHSHEMLFGFATAVIAGFLFTAVRNWTGLPTPTGLALAAFAALWLLARVLIIKGPAPIASTIDVLFLPAIALAIAGPILRSKNARNYKLLAIILVLAAAHAVFHLATLGYVQPWLSRISLFVSIDIVVILMTIVGGRVIPAFTNNAVPEANSRHESWVEIVTFTSMLLVALITVTSGAWTPPPMVMTSLLIAVAAAHAIRLALWEPGKTLHNPLLWMMPAAYSWIPFAFLLRALATQNVVPASAWIHAITMGAVSGLMLAMMMRSSLGHTGRKLVASRTDMAAFVMLQLAAIVRVVASVTAGETFRFWIVASGLLWILAFLLFVLRYLPMLSRPRATNSD